MHCITIINKNSIHLNNIRMLRVCRNKKHFVVWFKLHPSKIWWMSLSTTKTYHWTNGKQCRLFLIITRTQNLFCCIVCTCVVSSNLVYLSEWKIKTNALFIIYRRKVCSFAWWFSSNSCGFFANFTKILSTGKSDTYFIPTNPFQVFR